MIAEWMLWATGISVLFYAAAWAVDHAFRVLNRPARFAWAVALAAAVVVPAVLSMRRQEALSPPPSRLLGDVTLDIGALDISPAMSPNSSFDLRRLNQPLLVTWLVGSTLLLARFLSSASRLARRRRQWARAILDGEAVVIADAVGPALAGVLHPVIVVPRWLVDQPPPERALVLRHEVEHRRARDPLLLAVATLLAALVPWNLALWALRRRVRLAVEVDCDARVLSAGADPRSYGSMLLAIAERVAPGSAPSPALLEPPSFLEGRIRAMTPEPRRHPILRAGMAGSIAVAVIVAACGAPHPAPLRPAAPRAAEGESPLRQSRPIVVSPASMAVTPVSRTPRPSLGEASDPQQLESNAVQAVRPTSTTSQQIDLARLKRLVENTYPEVARLGSGDSAVWIMIQSFDGRNTYEARRAPLLRPTTSDAVAGLAGISLDSVISFTVSDYPVNDEPSAPVVDVVVARVRPGTRYARGWRTFMAPTEDQDSVRRNFEQIRLMLNREIPERFPQVRTAEETRLFFVLDHNYQIIRAERVEAPDVPAQRWGRREPGADWSGAFGYGTGTFGPGWVAAAFSVMPRP